MWNSRPITIIQNMRMESSRKMCLKDEISYLQMNYCRRQSKLNWFEHNSNVAKQLRKEEISYYWLALQKLYKDYQNLNKELTPTSAKHQRHASETSQDSFDVNLNATSPQSIGKQKQLSYLQQPLDLMKLYKYFEKYPMAFKQEIDEKNIYILENKKLRIRTERINHYK